jgi:hypothetical protein
MEWTAVSPRSLWNFRISGSFAGNSVCLSSLFLSHYCWATNCCLTIAGRPFVLLLARFSLDLTWLSWRFYWPFRFVNEFSAFEGWHSLSSSFALCKCRIVWYLWMQLFIYWLVASLDFLAWFFSRSCVGMVLPSVLWLGPLACSVLLELFQYRLPFSWIGIIFDDLFGSFELFILCGIFDLPRKRGHPSIFVGSLRGFS